MTAPDRPACPGILRRLACMGYESLLLLAILAVVFVLPHIVIGSFAHRLVAARLLWAHLFIVLLVYCVGFWSGRGQTLAMKTWHIRLTTKDGAAVRPLRALLRFVLCWPSILFFGTGLLWAAVDGDRQFLHDRLAGTRLVQL